MQESDEAIVVHIIEGAFFRQNGVALQGAPHDADSVTAAMSHNDYVRVVGRRAEGRGERDVVVALVLRTGGQYTNHSPELKSLLAQTIAEHGAKLDEIILVVHEDILSKKRYHTEAVAAYQRQEKSRDPSGAAFYVNMYSYQTFIMVVSESYSVPKHRILSDDEAAELVASQRLTGLELPVVFSDSPPVVWVGGRPDQIVRVEKDSPISGLAIEYRRIVRAPM